MPLLNFYSYMFLFIDLKTSDIHLVGSFPITSTTITLNHNVFTPMFTYRIQSELKTFGLNKCNQCGYAIDESWIENSTWKIHIWIKMMFYHSVPSNNIESIFLLLNACILWISIVFDCLFSFLRLWYWEVAYKNKTENKRNP